MEINGKVHCFFEQEEWRDIKGFEGLYQVSNMGRVKSLSRIVRAGKNKQRRMNGKVLAVFESMKVALRETGVNKVTISMVCRGKRKIGGGYIWRYAAKFI